MENVTSEQLVADTIINPAEEQVVPVSPIVENEEIFHNAILGIDFGCTKIVTSMMHVHSKYPIIVRNETSDLFTTNLCGFKGNQRLMGDLAAGQSQMHPHTCVEKINLLLQRAEVAVTEPTCERHGTLPITFLPPAESDFGETPHSRFQLSYNGKNEVFYAEQLYSMILNTIQQFCETTNTEFNNEPVKEAYFLVPETASTQLLHAINSSASLSKMNVLGFVTFSEALSMAYALKHPKDVSDDANSKHVMFIDMGASMFTLFVTKFTKDKGEVLDVVTLPIGGDSFDNKLFEHCKNYIKTNYNEDCNSNWRLCRRLFLALTKAKVILSTIPQTQIALSVGEIDIRIPITRAQLQDLCSEELTSISNTLKEFHAKHASLNLESLEVVGGATRMPFLIQALETLLPGIPLRHTLDSDLDASVGTVAVGASRTRGFQIKIECVHPNPTAFEIDVTNGHTLNQDQRDECIEVEERMAKVDADIKARSNLRNAIETLIFDMKDTLSNSKFAQYLDDSKKKEEYEEYLQEVTLWTEDCSDLARDVLAEKQKEIMDKRMTLLPKLDTHLKELESEKLRNAAEAASKKIETTSSKSTRHMTNKEKLEYAKEKKEQGTTHFVNLDYPAAVKRYTQAIEDVSTMFDETPDQVEESKALKLACYLNISQCLLKVQSFDKAIENCKYALAIDPDNAKAYFRRGSAYFSKKEYELAHPDLLKASDFLPQDKFVKSLFVKNQQQIALAKEREKKMYSAMFS